MFIADATYRRADYSSADLFDVRGCYGSVGWPALGSTIVESRRHRLGESQISGLLLPWPLVLPERSCSDVPEFAGRRPNDGELLP